VPSALKLLTTVADSGRARAQAVAAWSAAGAAAGASGFVVGGVVTDLAGWRVIFWGLVALAAGQVVAVLRLVPPDPRSGERTPLNLTGSVLLTAAVMLLVVGATFLGDERRRVTGAVLVAAAVVVATGFVLTDRRSAAPLLPNALLRAPQVLRGTAGSFVNTATTSVATLITLYLQATLGRTPLEAAATLLPLSLAVIGGAAAAGRLIVRLPRERVTAGGLGLIGAGIALPLVAPASAVLLGVGLAVAGVGLGLSAVATTSMGTDVDDASRATASGLINTSAQLGAAIGTALILLVAASTTGVPEATTGTPTVAWASAACLALVGSGLRAPPAGSDTGVNGHACPCMVMQREHRADVDGRGHRRHRVRGR